MAHARKVNGYIPVRCQGETWLSRAQLLVGQLRHPVVLSAHGAQHSGGGWTTHEGEVTEDRADPRLFQGQETVLDSSAKQELPAKRQL